MSEDGSTNNYLEQEVNLIEEETKDHEFLDGVCSKCLNSGFAHVVRNGMLGLAYRVEGTDAFNRPIKRLIRCTHNFSQNY